MSVTFTIAKSVPEDVDLHVVGVPSEELDAAVGTDDDVRAAVTAAGFEAKADQVVQVGRRLLIGLGAAEDLDAHGVRRAAALAARRSSKVERVAIEMPTEAVGAIAEGFALGAYEFHTYKSKPNPHRTAEVTVVSADPSAGRKALAAGARLAEATNVARDLVNEPGGTLTPKEFAKRTVALAKAAGLSVEVLDEKAMKAEGLAGTLAVNQGSAEAPRFVKLAYEPEGRTKGTVALVGKGITFDSGGLSLKPADGMAAMKCDMGGAAAVIATMTALRDLKVKVRVLAYVPMTDNMTGGAAQRLGDVIRYRNDKTVEVLNTDAEGRLILADGLCLASEAEPDVIIDLATLTGACMVALGSRFAGLFANDDDLAQQLQAAGEQAGDPLWRLPLEKTYRKEIDSKVADLKNTGGRMGGAITAGLFLQEFVADGIAWAHLDIAGPAFGDDDGGENPNGGTGFGVRLLLRFLKDFRTAR